MADILWSITDVIMTPNASALSMAVVQGLVERMISELGLSAQGACEVAIRKRKLRKPWVDEAIRAKQRGEAHEMPSEVECLQIEAELSVQSSQGSLQDCIVE